MKIRNGFVSNSSSSSFVVSLPKEVTCPQDLVTVLGIDPDKSDSLWNSIQWSMNYYSNHPSYLMAEFREAASSVLSSFCEETDTLNRMKGVKGLDSLQAAYDAYEPLEQQPGYQAALEKVGDILYPALSRKMGSPAYKAPTLPDGICARMAFRWYALQKKYGSWFEYREGHKYRKELALLEEKAAKAIHASMIADSSSIVSFTVDDHDGGDEGVYDLLDRLKHLHIDNH